jgi:hypothetical protein
MIIPINDVIQLYKQMNLPQNAGNKLVLAKGRYTLNVTDGFATAGRLELLENMTLQGGTKNPGDVIIDASKLPASSFSPQGGVPARTGAIRVGRGSNTLEYITFIGNPGTVQPLSVIDSDLTMPGMNTCRIRVANCIVTGGRIGINLRNFGTQGAGRTIQADLESNEIHSNLVSQSNNQQGQGIVFQNVNQAAGGIIQVTMKNNNVHNNIIGLKIFNSTGVANTNLINTQIIVKSENDHFDNNKLGMAITAAQNNLSGTTTVSKNSVTVATKNISVLNNGVIKKDGLYMPAGIFIVGATITPAGAVASNNLINVTLNGKISGNSNTDILVYGSWMVGDPPPAFPAGNFPGTNNQVNVQLIGSAKNVPMQLVSTNIPGSPGLGDIKFS